MTTLKDAKEAADSIIKRLRPISIILFGSVAREGIGTDLDLLVVIDDKSEGKGSPEWLLHKCLKRFYKKFAIDPFIISKSLLNRYYSKGSPFLRMISKEGRILYMKNAVREWLKQSEDELNTAEYLLHGGFFKTACYHAQQSIEKINKSKAIKKRMGTGKDSQY